MKYSVIDAFTVKTSMDRFQQGSIQVFCGTKKIIWSDSVVRSIPSLCNFDRMQ